MYPDENKRLEEHIRVKRYKGNTKYTVSLNNYVTANKG